MGRKVNRFDAVRQALTELGMDAKPIQVQNFLHERGVEMTTKHISTYKGTILKGKPAKKSAPPTEPMPTEMPASAVAEPANGAKKWAQPAPASLSVQIAMLKGVTEALGKEEAKKIIDLL